MGFFAIMNPVANTPVFLGLTADDSPEIRRAVARKALLLSFIIILVFCAAGKLIFDLFGITLPAFRITGGLLVFLVGFGWAKPVPIDWRNLHHPRRDMAFVALAGPSGSGKSTLLNLIGTLDLPDGIYGVDTTLRLPRTVSLRMAPHAVIRALPGFRGESVVLKTATGKDTDLHESSGWVHGGVIDGGKRGHTLYRPT